MADKSAEQIRAFTGPAILSYGFRPFFLFGAIWAGPRRRLWLPMLGGRLEFPSAFQPVEWHVHETRLRLRAGGHRRIPADGRPELDRPPAAGGTPLLVLFLPWVAGRAAIAGLGSRSARGCRSHRPCVPLLRRHRRRARDHRRQQHPQSEGPRGARRSCSSATGCSISRRTLGRSRLRHADRHRGHVMLVTLIGGRMIPSFTRNWLARRGPGRLPAPFDRFDSGHGGSGVALVSGWPPGTMPTAVFALAACV